MKALQKHVEGVRVQLIEIQATINQKKAVFARRSEDWQVSESGDLYLYKIEQMEEAREALREALNYLTTEPH